MSLTTLPTQKQLIESLARQMRRLERSDVRARVRVSERRDHVAESLRDSGPSDRSQPALPSGSRLNERTTGVFALDQLLVERGLPAGCLMEWLEPGTGSGVDTLALWAAARARRSNELLLVIDSRRDFYPPAGAPLGLDLRTTVVVRPHKAEEALWTLEQALRTPGVGVVVCPWRRLSAQAFRRLQLAAEKGGSLGVLVRPVRNRGEPSFAEVRWAVQSLPSAANGARRWRVELLRARRQMTGGSIELELRDDGSRLHLVSAVAAATGIVEATGA